MLIILSGEIKANHSVAANITYTYVSGNTYKLRLSFYRDCSGNASPFNVAIKAKSLSCADSTGAILNQISGTGQEVPPDCITQPTTCNGGILPGIQEWIYEGNITLPSQCSDWTFSYYICCRNGAINNIQNAISSGFYVYSTLNNLIGNNNSSSFINKPIPFLCLGSFFCFNQGAVDMDGDSLVYSLISPYENQGINVTYTGGYSSSLPIIATPVMTFNTQNGNICFNANTIQTCVLAVLVKEYRNGVLIGQVERDIQITILNCPCIILPVELLEFKGEIISHKNVLKWSTLSENNNQYFIIKKSSDMINFVEAAKISGHGNSTSRNDYQFIDSGNITGDRYYMLSQVDYNGKSELFKSIVVLNNTFNYRKTILFNILGQKTREIKTGIIFPR